MAQRRDAKGRFSSSGGRAPTSGTFRAGSRVADKGKDARGNANLMRTLKGGEKQAGASSTRNARSAAVSRASSSGRDAKLIGRAERSFAQRANQSKLKQRKMERERKSFARRGAARGGG